MNDHAPTTAPASPSRLRGWSVPIAFGLALVGYRLGMAPGLLWSDSAEMQILSAVGGVAHPTGYPLFTLVSRVFVALLGGEPARLANLFSALFAAATLALLVAFLLRRGVRAPAALAAALAWGTTFTFWSTSHRAEVYSLSAFVALAGLWTTLHALERGARLTRLVAGLLLGLTLAGHMAFAPFVMVAGLALAWRVPRAGVAWLANEVALLVAFLVGLSPYAYLVWADAHRQGLDYLHLLEIVQWPVEPVPEWFRSPLARLGWLITSRNEFPSMPFRLDVRLIAKNVADTAFLLGLFEWGPVSAAIVAFGALARWRTSRRAETRLLMGIAIASIVFSILTSGYKILSVFLIPCYLVLAVFAGHGFDALLDRVGRKLGRVRAVALVFLLPLASALLAHAARLATYDHPIPPLHSRVIEEDDIRQRGLIPSFVGYDEPRRFVESAAALFPDSALVISEWREVMALTYLQLVERRRTDLTLQPSGYPMLLAKVADWQRRHTVLQRPVVVVGPFTMMSHHFDQVDTVRLATGQAVWVTRTPLVRLDDPWKPEPAKPRR